MGITVFCDLVHTCVFACLALVTAFMCDSLCAIEVRLERPKVAEKLQRAV